MNEEQLYEQIDAYLSGELQGRALDKFKAELKEDKKLQDAVALQRAILVVLKEERESELKAYIHSETHKSAYTLTPRVKIILSTAAAIALLAAVSITLLPYLKGDKDTATQAENTTRSQKQDTPQEKDKITEIDTQTLALQDVKVPEPNIIEPPVEDVPIANAEENVESEINELEEELDDAVKYRNDSALETKEDIDPTETKSIITNETSKSLLKDTDILVKSDEILSTQNYPVYAVALDIDEVSVTKPSIRLSDSQLDKKISDVSEAETESTESIPKPTITRVLKVEYWKSVVNYKGYQYDGTKVKLYGVDPASTISFQELDSRLYIKMNDKNYYLEQNQKYNRLVEVTNPTLLKVLNE